MKKVLFVTGKWLNSDINQPTASNYDDIIYTFPKDVSDYDYDIISLDESVILYNQHADTAIVKYCSKVDVDIVIIVRVGLYEGNPSSNCLYALKKMGKKVCFFWLDSNPWDTQYQETYKQYIDLNVTWDCPSYNGQLFNNIGSNQLRLWALTSDILHHPIESPQVPVSFIGSLRYQKRAEYIPYVKEQIPELVINGGQRECNLTAFDYGRVISNSKININFPQHGMGYEQVKQRVIQVIASKSLLLENKNASTRSLLTPGQDYVEFGTKEDLCEKIRYYLEHEEERAKIAENGYNTYMQKYTSAIFWKKVFEKLVS